VSVGAPSARMAGPRLIQSAAARGASSRWPGERTSTASSSQAAAAGTSTWSMTGMRAGRRLAIKTPSSPATSTAPDICAPGDERADPGGRSMAAGREPMSRICSPDRHSQTSAARAGETPITTSRGSEPAGAWRRGASRAAEPGLAAWCAACWRCPLRAWLARRSSTVRTCRIASISPAGPGSSTATRHPLIGCRVAVDPLVRHNSAG
jgi:hypothetical protein